MSKGLTQEEKLRRIKELRPIDDIFFEVLAQSKEVAEEILRTILQDDQLEVIDVIVQKSERNLYGKSVRLDALCTLGNGIKCNIEVQRFNNDDHLRRVRYNASSITVKESNTGERYENVQELIIVYISEFDLFKGNKTIYHVDKVVRETNEVVDDGLHEIFVNTSVDDGSDIADLMKCFVQSDVNNAKFPKLSSEVRKIKSTEGGTGVMCEWMEKYMAESREEGREEGRVEGIEKGRAEGREEGREEGLNEGIEKGKLKQLIELVEENVVSISLAASKAGMTEDEFRKLL